MYARVSTIAKTIWVLHNETDVARSMIAAGEAGALLDELLSQLWQLLDRLETRGATAPPESQAVLVEICRISRSRLEATERSLALLSTLH